MSQSDHQSTSNTLDIPRSILPWLFALFIIIGYTWYIYFLTGNTKAPGPEWERLTMIFKSIEAIVFTAVGFIFGREVNRARAANAEKNEQEAKFEKQQLAQEILKKLPEAPKAPESVNLESQKLDSLRTMATIHLK